MRSHHEYGGCLFLNVPPVFLLLKPLSREETRVFACLSRDRHPREEATEFEGGVDRFPQPNNNYHFKCVKI
jgi:hypothetical protein